MERNFKICVECNQFLSEIYQFVTKSRIFDQMFMEFEQFEQLQQQPQHLENPELLIQSELVEPKYDYEEHIMSIREKFGLKPLVIPVETLNNIFDEQEQIAGALEIKLESDLGEFDVQNVLPENQEDISDSSEEEDEEDDDDSDIEQLSESRLIKHEEDLQLLTDTLEPDRDDQKRKKKKYRKSDEEKLFE